MVLELLDKVKDLLETGDRNKIFKGMEILYEHLFMLKESFSETQWQDFIGEARNHPINEILTEAPQFRHCQEWPRGYMGDAEQLDMIYGLGEAGRKIAESSPVGQYINEHQFGWAAEQAVRRRRVRIAHMIDRIACGNGSYPHIFSIACGHLREINLSYAFKAGLVGRFVALDHDEKSLENVENEYSHFNIEIVNKSIGAIFRNHVDEKFDFIYAAGLYDYLKDRTAKALTQILFEMLNPNGRILVANFTPETKDTGFMEVFMNWFLIYRGYEEMKQLTELLPENAEVHIYPEFFNESNRILYIEVMRKPE
ncbi:MAG: class I SAM-dependent methyltransferase [Desulfobacterales bacterium]|nr:class I SAM-dependent methyltransferase [Desulfobacterales bacterium]